MPIYEYQCAACHTITEKYSRVSEISVLVCPACSGPAQRIISCPVIRTDLAPYYDEGLGQRIESRQHRARVMKAQHAVEVDRG